MIRPSFLLLGILCAGLVRAEPTVLLPPEAGAGLAAGQTVELRFAGIPDDVEEFELFLVGGSDQRLALRLSESLPGETRTFVWTVPNLDLDGVRLTLRMDLDEREVEGVPSEPFSIEGSTARALARFDLRWGELWVAADTDGERSAPPSLPAAGLGHAEPSLARPAALLEFVTPPPAPALPETLSVSALLLERPSSPSPLRESASRSRAPLSIPPRI